MPLAFPSHQGLLAPLWRCWPGRFPILALWIGALVPDLIDGVVGLVQRDQLGQGVGHSLVGALVIGVPVGVASTAALRRGAMTCSRLPAVPAWRRLLRRLGRWLAAVDDLDAGLGGRHRLRREAIACWIGAWSHVLFDLPTHAHARLLWPFGEDPAWLGEWWHGAWFRISIPAYPDYPVGPHFAAWLALSVAGAVMFLRWPPRTL